MEIIQNGIKNVSKLIVTEENYTQFYKYSDADKYLFDTFQFDKKVILVVNAKVLVSYDLNKMVTEIDSIHKKVIIKKIPDEELTIIPDFKYYDFQQSVFNSFTRDELNAVQRSSIAKMTQNLKVAHSKEKARKRLLEELDQLWSVAKIMGWKVEDHTQNKLIDSVLKPAFKDLELEIN